MVLFNRIRIMFIPDSYFSKEIKKTKKSFSKRISFAEGIEKQNLFAERNSEIGFIVDEWEELKSDKIIRKANKYDISIPYMNQDGLNSQYWQEITGGLKILNSKGRSLVKAEIREESKWIRERTTFYITTIFGLIGVITGLFAIILK